MLTVTSLASFERDRMPGSVRQSVEERSAQSSKRVVEAFVGLHVSEKQVLPGRRWKGAANAGLRFWRCCPGSDATEKRWLSTGENGRDWVKMYDVGREEEEGDGGENSKSSSAASSGSKNGGLAGGGVNGREEEEADEPCSCSEDEEA
jgi:hypothetical protein